MINYSAWYKKRGLPFIFRRAQKLWERYNFTPQKGISRIRSCVQHLQEYDCHPTLFVPALVAKRNLTFIKELQDSGCEIGVHGYQHLDMRSLPAGKAVQQLQKALDVFTQSGIPVHGFRCPYLSLSSELAKEIPAGMFQYSSNRSIMWPLTPASAKENGLIFAIIKKFYSPTQSKSSISIPWFENDLLEIPVCVPDDLQLRDGLNYSSEDVASYLISTQEMIHQRGELFNVMFHPELALLLLNPFTTLLAKVSEQGSVWITQLREVSEWWNEKHTFRIQIDVSDGHFRLITHRTRRATLLTKGIELVKGTLPWDEKYKKVEPGLNVFDFEKLPLIGLSPGVQDWVKPALDGMGYIIAENVPAEKCEISLNKSFVDLHNDPVSLIAAIEDTKAPLIRFWPWPDGYRSALCISGDLDALSLLDYATRLLPV